MQYFYLGRTGAGIIAILITALTCGSASILWFIQGILMIVMNEQEFERKFIYTTSSFPCSDRGAPFAAPRGADVRFYKYHSTESYTRYYGINIIMVILTNKSLTTPDVIRNLGLRFRDYRLRLRMTRKEVSEAAAIGMTTLYKFESGNMTDMSFSTLLRLLRVIGLGENWEALLPELPESPYMYYDNDRKVQRVRHGKS